METKQRNLLVPFLAWAFLALAVLWPVSQWLKGAFPIFTVLWIVVPLIAVLVSKDPARVGFRRVEWTLFLRTLASNAGALLLLMLIVEPWSHTYQRLVNIAMAGQTPDTTFAWLVRFPTAPALVGMFLYSGLVTLFGEELFFRGWLLQLFKRRMGGAWAIVLQALLFCLPNLPVALVLPPLQGVLYVAVYPFIGIGLIGGWAAARTGSIWPSLVTAAVMNALLVAFFL